jgi:hypothetical protein
LIGPGDPFVNVSDRLAAVMKKNASQRYGGRSSTGQGAVRIRRQRQLGSRAGTSTACSISHGPFMSKSNFLDPIAGALLLGVGISLIGPAGTVAGRVARGIFFGSAFGYLGLAASTFVKYFRENEAIG